MVTIRFPNNVLFEMELKNKMERNLHLEKLGDYVRNQRKNMKMNQINFYKYLFPEKNLNDENIKKKMNSIENGKGKEMNYELLFRLREKFDVSIDYLLGFEIEYPNYENKAACEYTGLKPETIKQLHFWSKYLMMIEPEAEVDMTDNQLEELYLKKTRISEAKWIFEITNMLFQPKSQTDIKEGISDLTVLYDLYMMSFDKTKKIVGIPLDIANSGLSWFDQVGNNIALDPESLSFADSMNEIHTVNIKEITRKIWEERLLKDINIMISCMDMQE